MNIFTPEQIDEILPQTQCTLCGYKGCMPYAEALVYDNAPISQCSPGGIKTLHTLGQLLNQDPTPYIYEVEKNVKPKMLAVIREAECIGCTKCIQACPVDAIIGINKQMHSVISKDCTGCELCVAPCPVDCIDMVIISDSNDVSEEKPNYLRKRFNAKEKRLVQEKMTKNKIQYESSASKRKQYIQDAILRAKNKKSKI